MTEQQNPSPEAMRIAGEYTYAVRWDERRLGYTVTCDEVGTWNKPCISNVEDLLEATRRAVARVVDDRVARGMEPPKPLHPGKGRELTERSLRAALERSLDGIPFERSVRSPFTDDERRILETRLRWDDAGMFDMSDDGNVRGFGGIASDGRAGRREPRRLVYSSYQALVAVLIDVAAKQRDLGDCGSAADTDRVRFAVDDEFLGIDMADERAMADATIDHLHRYVAYSRILYEDEPYVRPGLSGEERWRIITGKASMSIMRDLFAMQWRSHVKLMRALHHGWPWADPLMGLPVGWATRFGAELLGDMQRVVDLGLDGFAIEQVEERLGGLRIYFDAGGGDDGGRGSDDGFDVRRTGLAGLMTALLDAYENLSLVTCIDCGSWHDVRLTRGWIRPICRRCALFDAVGRHHPDPEREWDAMTPVADDVTAWTREHVRSLDDPRLSQAHIHRLLEDRGVEHFVA
ncbi:hypothetical protein [Bifidobacterium parmae]|uniref:Uncharacterized protein n=1 Tax=Bifidobacterium parmae TaxID=361854 RepID=A0A2N5J4M6_9BIFI|nr:hypothetical protein [Bifidobacterium parmae]PLS29174.1 hypothetical protein Uis4E_0752 [Bifidobacterium parmae]